MSIKKRRKKKKHSPIKKFLLIVFTIVSSFVFLSVATFAGYVYVVNKNISDKTSENNDNPINNKIINEKNDNILSSITDILQPVAQKTNVAILGVDAEGLRTDVIIIASFDKNTKKINMLSIPRDTRLELGTKMYTDIYERNKNVKKVIKLNELHAYAGKEKNNEYSVKAIEELFNVNIDYYIKVNFQALRKIVDIIGGVEFDVPMNMVYEDPLQDLYINISKGIQKLNGAQAEQVIRFRKGYNSGDLGRIEVQQSFIKALIKQGLKPENILKAPKIINTLYEYIDTDLEIGDALKYIIYLNDINMDNVTMAMLPGTAKWINDISYFVHNEPETIKLVKKMFINNDNENQEETDNKIVSTKDKTIQILNGGQINGLAGSTKLKLEKDGFNIKEIGNYLGEKTNETRIYLSDNGYGEDLLKYFNHAKIIENHNDNPEGIDIQIVIGLEEK